MLTGRNVNIKALILMFCMILTSAGVVHAKKHTIMGRVFDKDTKVRLADATITVVNLTDDTVLGEGVDKGFGLQHNAESWVEVDFFANPADTFSIQVQVRKEGYRPASLTYLYTRSFPERFRIDVPVNLTKATPGEEESIGLEEVVVTATKVKMVMRGDTIVYNADAFMLSEGSMLDALIAQLPGATLDNNGRIMVNGKQIESLLVDGKDFFKGDPNVALRNLPAYVVSNVKVYEKSNPLARPGSMEERLDKTLVMDVNLKKQYQMGFVGSLEGGYGSNNRYLGRLFALEYTRQARIGAYANINNINNDSRGPGMSVNDGIIMDNGWQEARNNEGRRKLLKAGLDYYVNSTDDESQRYMKELIFKGSAQYDRITTDLEQYTSTADLLPGWPTRYGRMRLLDHNFSESVSTENSLMYWFNTNIAWIKANYRFVHGDSRTVATSAQFEKNPDESYIGEAIDSIDTGGAFGRRYGMIYLDRDNETGKSREVATDGSFYSNIRLTSGGLMGGLLFDWRYLNRHDDTDRRQTIDYTAADVDDINRSPVSRLPFRDWSYAPSLRLTQSLGRWGNLIVVDRFSVAHTRGSRKVIEPTDNLTPVEDYVVDELNSYWSGRHTNANHLSAELMSSFAFSDIYRLDINAALNVENGRRRLDYQRAEIDTVFSRNHTVWTPRLNLRFNKDGASRKEWALNARVNEVLPEMTRLLRTVDTYNPMTVRLGNPGLKKMTALYLNATFNSNNQTTKRLLFASASFNRFWNRMANYKIYDEESGVSTYMPVNISGAYEAKARVNYSQPFDRQQNLWFSTSTSAEYTHLPDYVSVSGSESAVRSLVHNTLISESLGLKWNIGKGVRTSVAFDAQWRTVSSPLAAFNDLNIWNFKTGAAVTARLPLEFDLSTDFNYYRQSGYEDNSFNKGHFVWNLRLERSFIHGALNAKIDAYDILGQISNVTATVNSLGNTETWTNSMSRYVLLSLAWRFTIMPKK